MAKPEQTKKRILDASLHLISNKGYLGTTTREIAREAGIAECTIFKHFPTKLAIFDALVNSYEVFHIQLTLNDLKKLDYREALMTIGRAFLEMLFNNKELVRIFLVETFTYPDKLIGLHNSVTRQADDVIESYLKEMQAKGDLRPFDVPETVRALKGMILFIFQRNLFFPKEDMKPVDWDANLRLFVDIFANGTVRH